MNKTNNPFIALEDKEKRIILEKTENEESSRHLAFNHSALIDTTCSRSLGNADIIIRSMNLEEIKEEISNFIGDNENA